MKIVIFGLGSIGKRYARLLKAMHPEHELAAYRFLSTAPKNEFGIHEIYGWHEIKAIRPDVAFICNPTALHIETALLCAKEGMHLFIEKPVSSDTKGLSTLMNTVEKKHLTSYIAYCLRFHPVIRKLKELIREANVIHANIRCSSYLPEWRKGADHLSQYSAWRSMGGGVILDLSHEFDYAEYLFGRIFSIKGSAGISGTVTVDAEDWADAVIAHDGGCVTNLHVNFMSRCIERSIAIDTRDAFYMADLNRGTIERTDGNGTETVFTAERRSDEMYAAQLGYFFENIGNSGIMNSLAQAAPLYRKILAFRNRATR